MKTIVLTSLLTIFITLNAGAVSADQSLMDLKRAEKIFSTLPDMGKYKPEDRDNDKVTQQQDKGFKILEDAVKAYLESPEDELLLEEILKVAVASNKKDPTVYASEIVSPIASKQKARLDKVLKKLPGKDATDLQRTIQNSLREQSNGNG
ncbi:hypothetical protein [Bdellovibrio sp. HCB274]|uniref:hypothetical protein n=1 Tax=Bdellovibrio sp. HCB274 TaxID=3394361 RepID=UPI0039B47B7A